MGLVTLTFDLLTFKLVCESRQKWGILPNLGTLGLWVLELFTMYATDGQTGGQTKATLIVTFPTGRGIIRLQCARGITLLKLTTDGHKASRGLSATAKLLVLASIEASFSKLVVWSYLPPYTLVAVAIGLEYNAAHSSVARLLSRLAVIELSSSVCVESRIEQSSSVYVESQCRVFCSQSRCTVISSQSS